jgi:hypothetical protein
LTFDDKLTRGFVAGVLGGVVQSGITNPLYVLKLTKLRWLDFASVIVFGKRPEGFSQAFVSEVVTTIWSGLLGIGYTYALPRLGERNHRFKGMLYGVSSWFSIYSVVHLLDVSRLMKIDRNTATIHGVVSALWGLVMDETLDRLEKSTEHTPALQDDTNLVNERYRITHDLKQHDSSTSTV